MSGVLRGRDEEVRTLKTMLDRLAEGAGGSAVIEGMAGIGKTALLQEVGGLATAAGCAVAAGSADELDRITPMGAMIGALRAPTSPVLTTGDLEELHTSDQRIWLLDRLQRILETESERHPLVITIDDLQWADHATLLAVGTLPPRLFAFPILWVVARRTTPSNQALEAAMQHLREGDATQLVLQPLDDNAVAALAEDLLGATPSDALVADLVGAAGNPFYLTQVLKQLVGSGSVTLRAGAAVVDTTTPPDLTVDIKSHLASLSDASQRVLEIGSIFGRRFSLSVVADMTGQPAGQLIEPVTECRRAELLAEEGEWLAFNHDLLRQAVYDGLPRSVRVALHRDAARLLLSYNATPLEVAPHLALSARPGDAVAVNSLREAASSLVGSNPDAAADLALRAFELSPPTDPRRVETAMLAADALGWAARLSEAEKVRETVLSEGDVDPVTEAIIELGIRRSWMQIASRPYVRGVPQRLVDDPQLPAPLRVCLLALEAGPGMFDDLAASARRLDAIRSEADASGADFAVAAVWIYQLIAMLFMGRLTSALDGARVALAWSEEGGPDATRLRNQGFDFTVALALYSLDRPDDALEALQASDRHALRFGNITTPAVDEAIRGAVLLAQGRLDDAVAAAEGGRRMAEDHGLSRTLAESLRVLGEVAFARGDLSAAAAYVKALQPLLDDGTAAPMTTWLPAIVADARGDADAAFEIIAPAVDRFDHDDFTLVVSDAERLPQLVAIASRARQIDRAIAISGHAERLAELNGETPLFRGVAAHCRAMIERDVDLLAKAVEILRDCRRPLALANALEDLGTQRSVMGHEGSEVALSEAFDIASRCDAQRQEARIRKKLRTLGVTKRAVSVARPTAGWESLTRAEWAVAEMVAEGETSRAVAERLYLSTNTVNTHLRHVFTKLGIRSRVELARVFLSR